MRSEMARFTNKLPVQSVQLTRPAAAPRFQLVEPSKMQAAIGIFGIARIGTVNPTQMA